jgi:hypothetical protein
MANARADRSSEDISANPSEVTGTAYAQGDVLLLRVADAEPGDGVSQQGPVILAEGEHTGHRHAFYGGALMFRDDAMARDVPSQLYIGHVEIGNGGAVLEHGPGPGQHGDHDPVHVPAGTYIALRQREYTGAEARRVVD